MDKGRKVLLKTFGNDTFEGYKEPTAEEFAIAAAEGYMFEETRLLPH